MRSPRGWRGQGEVAGPFSTPDADLVADPSGVPAVNSANECGNPADTDSFPGDGPRTLAQGSRPDYLAGQVSVDLLGVIGLVGGVVAGHGEEQWTML